MSIPVMRAVVDSERYGGLRKLVLLALAAYSDPDGTSIFPSVDTVAKKTGLSARAVQRHMRALEREGVLVRVARSRRHRPNEYRIDLQALGVSPATPLDGLEASPATPLKGPRGVAASVRGVASDAKGCRWRHPTYQDQSFDLRNSPLASPAEGQARGETPTRKDIEAEIASWQAGLDDLDLTNPNQCTLATLPRRKIDELRAKLENAA